MRLLDFYIIWRGDMLFATVVPIAYFLLYLKNKQVTFVFLKFVMAFVICLYWATYACTFFYSYYDVIGWFKILIIPVLSIYSGFVLHLLKSKKKKQQKQLQTMKKLLKTLKIKQKKLLKKKKLILFKKNMIL